MGHYDRSDWEEEEADRQRRKDGQRFLDQLLVYVTTTDAMKAGHDLKALDSFCFVIDDMPLTKNQRSYADRIKQWFRDVRHPK